jgi:hypothetical protein
MFICVIYLIFSIFLELEEFNNILYIYTYISLPLIQIQLLRLYQNISIKNKYKYEI